MHKIHTYCLNSKKSSPEGRLMINNYIELLIFGGRFY